MKLGITVHNKGPESSRALMVRCAQTAERNGLDDLWIEDHVAIPPDDAEGSGGRYLDPMTTLAYLAACTQEIGLGTGVLNIPYRAPLPTAKAIATVQELSGGRLSVGVGVGWMAAEFKALGISRSDRGRLTNEGLAFIRRCFAADEVESNGQPFLFLPRPACPPIYIGGGAPHALERTVAYGDGWLPMAGNPQKLREPIQQLGEMAAKAGKPTPEVKVMTALPLSDPQKALDMASAMLEVGVTSLVHGARYREFSEFEEQAERASACRGALSGR